MRSATARVSRILVPRIGEAAKYHDGIHEGVHGVGFALRLGSALRAGDVFPGRVMIERVAGLSKETSSGSTTGRSLSGTGTTPQLGQWITGIGQPQYAVARYPSRAGGSSLFARRPACCARRTFQTFATSSWLLDGHAVKEAVN